MWANLNKRAWLISFKTALAAVIAMGLAMRLGWDKPYWSGISAIVVSLPYVGASLEKGGMRLVGTFAAGLCAYIIMATFAQNQIGFCALLAVFLGFASYMAQGKKYPYMYFLYGITLTIISVESLGDIQNLWTIAFFRISEICLGVIVTLSVNTLLWPLRASTDLNAVAANTLQDCQRLFDYAVLRYDTGEDHQQEIDSLRAALDTNILKLKTLLPQAMLDSSAFSHHHASVERALQDLERILVTAIAVTYSTREQDPRKFRENLAGELKTYTNAIRTDISILANFFKNNGELPPPESATARAPLAAKIEALRQSGIHQRYTAEDLVHFRAYYTNLVDLESALMILREALAGILKPGRERTEIHRNMQSAAPAWRPDSVRLKHAVKVPAAIIFTIYLWKWTQFPGGLDAVIMVTVLCISSMVASNWYSLVRLGAYLSLGGAGTLILLFLEPHMDTYLQYGAVLFVLLMFFSMVNQSTKGYAYAGFPALLAFIQVTWIYSTQVVSIISKVETFIGVSVGAMITVVTLRLLWPLIPEQQLRLNLCRFLKESQNSLKQCMPHTLAVATATQGTQQPLLSSPGPLVSADTWIGRIGLPRRKEPQRQSYQQLLRQLEAFRQRIQALQQVAQRPMAESVAKRLAPFMAELNDKVSEHLHLLELALQNGRIAQSNSYPDIATPLSRLDSDLHAMLNQKDASSDEGASFLAIVRRYHDLINETYNCRTRIENLDLSIMNRNAFF